MGQELLSSLPQLILIILGAGTLFVVVGILVQLFTSRREKQRLESFVTETRRYQPSRPVGYFDPSKMEDFREWINDHLSRLSSDRLKHQISSAYWPISDVEFILLRVFLAGIGLLIGWLISKNFIGGIGLAFFFYLLPNFFLRRSIIKRQKQFQDQLIDVLLMIRGAVQAGYGLLQSLDVVVSEMSAPASEEFERVIREVQIGYSLTQALTNLSARMENDDLQLVVTAIIINTQVGGNLTTMLTAVTNTIRARYQLFGEVRSLTSYARYAGYLLSFLPFATAIFMFLVSPDYYESAMSSPISQLVLLLALVLIIVGNIWLRQIAKIQV
jgi:tight adherence protein B